MATTTKVSKKKKRPLKWLKDPVLTQKMRKALLEIKGGATFTETEQKFNICLEKCISKGS